MSSIHLDVSSPREPAFSVSSSRACPAATIDAEVHWHNYNYIKRGVTGKSRCQMLISGKFYPVSIKVWVWEAKQRYTIIYLNKTVIKIPRLLTGAIALAPFL